MDTAADTAADMAADTAAVMAEATAEAAVMVADMAEVTVDTGAAITASDQPTSRPLWRLLKI